MIPLDALAGVWAMKVLAVAAAGVARPVAGLRLGHALGWGVLVRAVGHGRAQLEYDAGLARVDVALDLDARGGQDHFVAGAATGALGRDERGGDVASFSLR